MAAFNYEQVKHDFEQTYVPTVWAHRELQPAIATRPTAKSEVRSIIDAQSVPLVLFIMRRLDGEVDVGFWGTRAYQRAELRAMVDDYWLSGTTVFANVRTSIATIDVVPSPKSKRRQVVRRPQ